jgi:hypothetical protein
MFSSPECSSLGWFKEQGIAPTTIIRHVWGMAGCAIAQAVSRWLPTAAAQVRSQVKSCGICGGQSGTGAGFL